MRKPIFQASGLGKTGLFLRYKLVLILTAILLWLPATGNMLAASGDLDSTFDADGKLTADFGNSGVDRAFAVGIQTDGKVVVAGVANQNTESSFAVARYNSDGSADSTFGTAGRVMTKFRDFGDQANALAIQSDGKIVVAGSTGSGIHSDRDFALARYNSDGSLDTEFGSGGKVTTDILGGHDDAKAIALQRNGKIVVAGDAFGDAIVFALARYNSDGSLDTDFGTGGKVTTDFGGRLDQAIVFAALIQNDGKIIAGGRADDISSNFGLARYNKSGSLDSTFGSGGKLTTDFGGRNDEGHGLALQGDGKIILAGTTTAGIDSDFAIARYNPDGSLDGSFGSGGKVLTDFGGVFEGANAIALQFDGKMIVAGSSGLGFALARYNADGSPDASFGTAGRITSKFNSSCGSAEAFALALQSDRKIVAAGDAFDCGTGFDFALARFEALKPTIKSVSISGKTLSVAGQDFNDGADILINGEKQKTANDEASPTTLLRAKKGGKRIGIGQTVLLRVRNSGGTLSDEVAFTRLNESSASSELTGTER